MLCQDVRAQDAVRMAPAGSGMATLSPSRQQVRDIKAAAVRAAAAGVWTFRLLPDMCLPAINDSDTSEHGAGRLYCYRARGMCNGSEVAATVTS